MSRVLFAVLLALAVAPAARASVVMRMSLDELVDRADVIVHGRVVRQDSAWEGGRIVTRSTLAVDGALKGTLGKTLVVRTQGGVVEGIGQRVFGEAALAAGEELVLFARHVGAEVRPVGMAQGKFRVVLDGGVHRAVQELGGLALASRPPASGAPLEIAHAAGARPTLAAFFARIAERLSKKSPR